MFLNTSLAHYQLPLFGLNSMSLATEIGADQRSIFLRPITAAGEQPSESWPVTVEVKKTDTVPQEYRNWLARITNYQQASGPNAAPSLPGQGSPPASAGPEAPDASPAENPDPPATAGSGTGTGDSSVGAEDPEGTPAGGTGESGGGTEQAAGDTGAGGGTASGGTSSGDTSSGGTSSSGTSSGGTSSGGTSSGGTSSGGTSSGGTSSGGGGLGGLLGSVLR